jgi:CO/xanthine dehydrogenase FAD-binding subunit
MKHGFTYQAVHSLDEALKCLGGSGCLPYAGGTDVLVGVRDGSLQPEKLIDIKPIPELRVIRWEDHHVRVGACVTINELGRSEVLAEHFTALAHAARKFGCFEIRHRATIGGNIANAAPCAQTAPPLAVLEAVVELRTNQGIRLVPFTEFITGVGKTILQPGELITAFLLPKQPAGTVGTALRVARVDGMDLPSVNLAVLVIDPRRPEARKVRFCLGSVATKPTRFPDLEERLSHRSLTSDLIVQVAADVADRISPRAGSLRASPFFKKTMAGLLLGKALAGLLQQPELSLLADGASWI